jgi:uncharacterized protein YerC
MPHLSQKKLKKDAFKRISRQFTKTIAELETKTETNKFLNEILTDTERTMLAKRLALLMMLKKEIPYSVIEGTLKVTPQTIARYWKKTKQHGFEVITAKLDKDKAREEFWNSVERFLLIGRPSQSHRQRKRLKRNW